MVFENNLVCFTRSKGHALNILVHNPLNKQGTATSLVLGGLMSLDFFGLVLVLDALIGKNVTIRSGFLYPALRLLEAVLVVAEGFLNFIPKEWTSK